MSDVATVGLASKLAGMITRLGSDFDSEVIAAARALKRTLQSNR